MANDEADGDRDWRKRVGVAVREARKARRVSQAELAKDVGVDVRTINRLERGVTAPRLETLEPIADRLGATLDELTGRAPVAERSPDAEMGSLLRQIADLRRELAQTNLEWAEAVERVRREIRDGQLAPARKRAAG